VALASVERLSFSYPHAACPSLDGVSLTVGAGETVALLGPSGSGKSTLLRALSGLVPHFHGGRFTGSVLVGGLDTRRARPAELAATVATVFQDPEDQVVMGTVENEVAFGPENLGVPTREIPGRVEEALGLVGALHLFGRRTSELSGGELQRVCLASALALHPRLLLLDEPTSQLDPDGADAFLGAVAELGIATVVSEHRIARAFDLAERVVFLDGGRVLLDAPESEARGWLARARPAFSPNGHAAVLPGGGGDSGGSEVLLALDDVAFAYDRVPVLDGVRLEVRAGEVVVLEGPNGGGKTTLAKLATGLLEPARGTIERRGRVCYLSQDPGRYLATERVLDEVALSVSGDRERARAALARVDLAWAEDRHPRDLSSGERERLGLAAVTVSEPSVLVLDEPTRGVDPERKQALAAWLATYAAEGNAVLVVTHDRELPAHRRIRLGSGEVARV